jgi:hypothetical protein
MMQPNTYSWDLMRCRMICNFHKEPYVTPRLPVTAVPHYAFTYTPLRDSFSPIFTDFRLVAMPPRKGVPHVNPIAVDSRGRIFSYIGWSITDQQTSFVPTLVEAADNFQMSLIHGLREEIRLVMQSNAALRQQCSRR